MQRTLLEIVQDVLGAISSDEVDDISDTQDAEDVVRIVRRVYADMITQRDWPHLRKVVALTASGDSAKPTHMTFDSKISKIVSVKYDNRKTGETQRQYLPVTYKSPEDFLDILDGRNNDETNIDIITDYGGTELLIKNDASPQYYTSFDDTKIVMDAYDSVIGSTLVGARTKAIVYEEGTFTASNTFVINLPDKAFQHLINEAMSTAFIELKEVANSKVEKDARVSGQRLAIEKHRVNNSTKAETPDYGR